ncbi:MULTISPECIES: sugar ABC transporter permease [Micromonospora]|uniref:Xylose transport system permease protein XylH n=1 Tax=Micromonospora solifontis TaxID=2487138 RepID=A0ABX9WCL6_9ACTN|nr:MULTISPECIES: ABC transporter permease [Micromonospora]NES12685.1 ABC transporter permease [Micromonospora sp. PPF5-17B]NES38197.1 ABC transporter permease [Micromonospora solifontis]NES54430.1 ABC transporter permease [Micromonospora sp. PPF5-6]RNL96462.1 ABC transporter permease [Micromonospora solifontis]
MTTTAVKKEGPAAVTPAPTVGTHLNNYWRRVRGGDIGALPAVFMLLALCVGFSIARPSFFTAGNFANLFTQGAAVTLIAMGLVFVLLLGEIDLSAGFASGVCAAILANVVTVLGYPWYVAVLAAIVTGVVIGTVLGLLVAKVGIPSFVVTLAGFLAFQGVVLMLMKSGANISVRDDTLVAIANRNLSPALGWALAAVAVAGYAAVQLLRHRNRAARGLLTDPIAVIAARIVGLGVVLGVPVFILNQERSRLALISSVKGVPIVVPIIALLLVLWTFVLHRTSYGRHVYAVGGNAEAARRAGINVDRIRISVFVICSTMAAIGGIVAASRANSVDPNTGGSNVLLYAVGAAVIGGTSLFGGKGRVLDAVLGGAVVAVIDNGMGLMGYSSGVKYVVTGVVLLAAATIDALSRRRAAATGTR